MKRVMLSLVLGAMLCANGEMLKNGDFEIGTLPGADGWKMCPHYRVEQGAGRNGTRGLIVENHDPNAMNGEFCGQFVNVKPGFKYRFSGWVKCEDVKGMAKATGIGARVLVLVFVFDAKGKGLGEYYTQFKAGTVSDWTRIEGVTPALPPTAARIQVNPFVWHNATGRAWFDDISLEQVESVPVRGLYSSAYRDLAWEGKVRFSAILGIDTAAMPLDTLTAVFAYSAGNYACAHVQAEKFTATYAEATIPVDRLPPGTYPISFELRSKKDRKLIAEMPLRFTRTASAPPRKVWLDSHNRLIVEGKPFFPLGFFGQGVEEKYLSKLDGTPFNCYMPYKYLGKTGFDTAAKHGLWIIANMKDFIPGKAGAPNWKFLESQGDADRRLAERFYALKGHPKLLAWYLNDESSVEHLGRLTRQYRFVRDNDADHPAWSVLYQQDQVREYLGTCDIVGNDNYPVGRRPIESVSTHGHNTWEGFLRGPCWHVPQSFNWKSYFAKGKGKVDAENCRMPTREEARSMSWQYIANGGNGLIYYSLERLIDEGCMHWENYCTVAREIKALESILLSDPAPNASGYPELLTGRAWMKDGKTYLLVANKNGAQHQADLKLAWRFSSARAMKELPGETKFTLAGDKLHVELPPLGVSMLELDPAGCEPREAIPDNSHESRRDKGIESGPFGDCWWKNRFHNHLGRIAELKGGTVDLALVGDSITHFWELKHPSSWMALTNRYSVINLGYGGDRTQDVLWRIMNGELDGYRAKVVMLMIGTNNNAANDSRPENVARGVERIIEVIREKQPQAKIILMPIFPRGSRAEWTIRYHDGAHRRNLQTNPLLQKLADGKTVFWLDFNSRLADADGYVPYDIMNDAIHPTAKGYAIWMEALLPLLDRLL